MYNPINMVVEDEKRLQEKDLREKNKKARYQVRYVAEDTTRKEQLAEQERNDKMSLSKVSRQRVAEELNRGFDILTNNELRGGLAQIEATEYMKSAPKVWDQICSKTQDKGFEMSGPMSSNSNVDFHATQFASRSRRLSTHVGPEATKAAALETKPAEYNSSSRRSNMPPSVRSQIGSHSSKPLPGAVPQSTRSAMTTGSGRPIRTGGFQKIGA